MSAALWSKPIMCFTWATGSCFTGRPKIIGTANSGGGFWEVPHVVVFIIPGKRIGAHFIEIPIFSKYAFFSNVVFKIVKSDFSVMSYPVMDFIHVIIDGLVHV